MFVFTVDNPHVGLAEVLTALKTEGIESESRNGPVVRFPRPVCIQYNDPRRRLITAPLRDGNPFFHLFETMWMLGGMSEIEPLLMYNPGMANYSDDNKNLRGSAYGYRWRRQFGHRGVRVPAPIPTPVPLSGSGGAGVSLYNASSIQQFVRREVDDLEYVIHALRKDPTDRRVLLSMWDPYKDLGAESKDLPCNLQVLFSARPDASADGGYLLDMTVTNRSNDLIYGSMGSNVFHFSMLHEHVAGAAGLGLGRYYQISNNLHLYKENPVSARCYADPQAIADYPALDSDMSMQRYGFPASAEVPEKFVNGGVTDSLYLEKVVRPLVEAYRIFKLKSRAGIEIPSSKRIDFAKEVAGQCQSPQLAQAAVEWLARRVKVDS